MVNIKLHHIFSKISPNPSISSILLSSETAMGVRPTKIDELDDYRHQMDKIGKLHIERKYIPWFINDWLYFTFGKGQIERQFVKQAQKFTGGVIAAKRKHFMSNQTRLMSGNESNSELLHIDHNKKQRLAMLDTLLIAEQNQQIDAAGIQEEVETFILGGFDTTMTVITFTLFAIANNKDVQSRLYEEIASMGDEQNYSKFQYLDAVIKESLRMFPPAPIIGRVLGEDTIIGRMKSK